MSLSPGDARRDALRPPVLFPLVRHRHRLGCGNGVRNFDIQTHTKTGKVIWLNVSSLPVPSRKKDRFLFAHLFRDISKRMRILGLAEELHTLLAPWRSLPRRHHAAPEHWKPPSPHYSRALLLQSRIRRCDKLGRMAGGLAARSVNILFKDASLPPGSARPSRWATPRFRDEPS